MSKKYIALTIGSIHRTLQMARSTRAIWSASFMFSWTMREIVKKLRNTEGVRFIAPFDGKIDEEQDFCLKPLRGVGLFHDRIILETDGADLACLTVCIDSVLGKLSEKIAKTGCDQATVLNYLNGYIQCHKLEITEDSNFNSISGYLDTMECQPSFIENEKEPYLVDFFEYLERGEYNEFIETEFTDEKGDRRFPSTAEVATADLRLNPRYSQAVGRLRELERSIYSETAEQRKQEKRAYKKQKELDTQIIFYNTISNLQIARQRHKYIAVVLADGDGMGAFIKSINDYYNQTDKEKPQSERFNLFSKRLMLFAAHAVEEIKKFGATPIYAGGDDLLFFSPLVGTEGVSFLTLLDSLDDLFKEYISNFDDFKPFFEVEVDGIKIQKLPTMSYGISVTYYKFPLGETHEQAVKQLFEKAKRIGNKNNLALEVQKHSGQLFGGVYSKGLPSYKHMKTLIEDGLNRNNADELINSVAFKLQAFEGLLKGIVKRTDFAERLKSFFENNFDEGIHKTANGKAFLDKVRLFIESILSETQSIIWKNYDVKSFEKKMEADLFRIYGVLRLMHFLQAPFKAEEDRDFIKILETDHA